jgi:hypothetical protein
MFKLLTPWCAVLGAALLGGATPPGAKRRGAASEVFMGPDTSCMYSYV